MKKFVLFYMLMLVIGVVGVVYCAAFGVRLKRYHFAE